MVFRPDITLKVAENLMFPSHCKEVSVKSVTFPLTANGMKRFLEGKRAYIRTKYYVFNREKEWAIASIEKDETNEILQRIVSVQIVALPDETSFVADPSLDVLSATLMGKLRQRSGTKAIVVKGKADHVSFFVDEAAADITVFDTVPPRPTKLSDLIDTVLASDLQGRCVNAKVVEVDLNELARRARTGVIMYPCRASGLKSGSRVLYLDETPWLSEEEIGEITLLGCSLSLRIFKAVYGCEPRGFINMCPLDLVKERRFEGPVLVKCCKVKEGFQTEGRVAIVPWGARSSEVAGALRHLLG